MKFQLHFSRTKYYNIQYTTSEAVCVKILIIEDEKLLADSLKTLLESKGFTVETVYDGESGEAYAETGVYDLLILDVMMPNVDGLEVCKQLRSKSNNIGIIMLTAKTQEMDKITGLMELLGEDNNKKIKDKVT